MVSYRVAFRNEQTKWQWIKIGDFVGTYGLDCAKQYIESMLLDMPKSEMGIFNMPEGAAHWLTRSPRWLYNRQGNSDPIPASVGNIIDSMYEPG